MGKRYVNIGCGDVFHEEWINIDLLSYSKHVMSHDIRRGLPLPDKSVDVCYSSHVLEHLRNEEARFFLSEQRRILKSGGIIRVVVPDLEQIARNYLFYLSGLTRDNAASEFNYDWSLLEMCDQTTRDVRGGQMAVLLRSAKPDDRDFVISRCGREVEKFLHSEQAPPRLKTALSRLRTCRKTLFRQSVKRFRFAVARITVRAIGGVEAARSFQEGLFRNSGEVHRVMYDRYSLRRLLLTEGFSDILLCKADESRIPDFKKYKLDAEDGVVRKPDSIFVEGVLRRSDE